ncbi:phage tail protein [Luteolibacter yonseiensis]|uniref:Phage tail protein n=1 Tax=Luteolibacter yonseiensis TaxID=1144680 RepID=A0A934VC74_9BACT|nr:tail fiber protein [Luteolibacter yonseiensis]MBK1818033.1 phage tail protein [Luteolibacter yonseiensis]
MATPFVAEITLFAGNFAPRGYAFCNGQLLSIAQNTALFSLLGTTYGGNGQTTFALPDLQGRLPMHPGQGPGLTQRVLGEKSGTETVTLTTSHLPSHNHTVSQGFGSAADSPSPLGRYPAVPASGTPYSGTTGTQMAASTVTSLASSGGNQPHNNLMPSLCVNFIIATQGVFPSRN